MSEIELFELTKNDNLPTLKYKYLTNSFYDVIVLRDNDSWKIELTLTPLLEPLEKTGDITMFKPFIEEPRVFTAVLDDEQVGWIEVGYQNYNNRMRVWQFFVKEKFRRKGVGTLLMNQAIKTAREKGARILVLETQTCNVSAIDFYLRYGFELIGLDIAHYSNEDIEKKEVRLELGLKL